MITAVCINPAIDKTAKADSISYKDVNRLYDVRSDPGGKAVNTALILSRLGSKVNCLCCIGRQNAAFFCSLLERCRLPYVPFWVEGSVRTNLKIEDCSQQKMLELNEPGFAFSEDAQASFLKCFEQTATESDWIVLSGSLPKDVPDSFYLSCMRRHPGKRYLVDCTGNAFREALKGHPFLVKPNLAELEMYCRTSLNTLSEIQSAAALLMHDGAQNVAVSLGKRGAVLVSESGSFFSEEIPVPVRSTVGAGDAMVAGMVCALDGGQSMMEAFACGMAAGTAAVMTEGTQPFEPADYRKIQNCVKVSML